MATAGIKLSIDDFGSGYSNFSYLTELPVSSLKLDKSLIDNVASDERSCLKVQAIVKLAKRLGYTTVAEGAESEDQIIKLRSLDCDELQGYALSRPLGSTQLAELLTSKCR
jgi:EAL domain-containing protein (putative c-di-GMP-specific phosphodiesterase class I)